MHAANVDGLDENADRRKKFHRADEVRKERGISRRKLAAMLGLTPQELVSLLEPWTNVSMSQILCLAEALDVSPAELIIDERTDAANPKLSAGALRRLYELVASIEEQATEIGVQRMTEQLRSQLDELATEARIPLDKLKFKSRPDTPFRYGEDDEEELL